MLEKVLEIDTASLLVTSKDTDKIAHVRELPPPHRIHSIRHGFTNKQVRKIGIKEPAGEISNRHSANKRAGKGRRDDLYQR